MKGKNGNTAEIQFPNWMICEKKHWSLVFRENRKKKLALRFLTYGTEFSIRPLANTHDRFQNSALIREIENRGFYMHSAKTLIRLHDQIDRCLSGHSRLAYDFRAV